MNQQPRILFLAFAVSIFFLLAGTSRAADTAAGEIKNVSADKGELVLTDKAGKEWTFEVGSATKVFLNDREAELKDLKAGDDANVEYEKQSPLKATEIRVKRGDGRFFTAAFARALLAEDKAGGTIKSLLPDKMEFVLTDKNGKDWTFHVGKKADVRLNDKKAELEDLMAGDTVTITYEKKGEKLNAKAVHAKRAEP